MYNNLEKLNSDLSWLAYVENKPHLLKTMLDYEQMREISRQIMVADTHHRRVEAWIDSKGNTASWDHPDAHTVRVDWDYAMSLSDWEEMI